ncbi:DNA-binding protein [Pseudomonas frederiksbergensis]|uniref:DNA-binding protein n=1 Tax=Pseudomonas frederiksbergensis TaxID=104087 RepID=A0A1J0EET5_9PSED|nr:Mor transcription activator family protein [Pseudomonas frederiksbergensis]APC14561.1 DNA-binding protein [Pseudomonas frederiksbergensis]
MSTIRGSDLLSETIEPMAKVIQESLGVSADLAEATSVEITTLFAHLWGGQVVYVPKGVCIQASRLHQKIYDDFTGRNHHEVATKHGVSVQQVYRVVKRMRLAIIARNQRDLFVPDEE